MYVCICTNFVCKYEKIFILNILYKHFWNKINSIYYIVPFWIYIVYNNSRYIGLGNV